MKVLFFGVWGEPGHCLVGPGKQRSGLPNGEAWDLSCALDSHFAPKRKNNGPIVWGDRERYAVECTQGQFLRHRHGKWSLLQWWDRCQGDKRGACNSTILLEGERTTEELLAALAEHFPHVLENLKKHGVELVEVFP